MPDNFALRVIHHRDGPVLTVTKLKPKSSGEVLVEWSYPHSDE